MELSPAESQLLVLGVDPQHSAYSRIICHHFRVRLDLHCVCVNTIFSPFYLILIHINCTTNVCVESLGLRFVVLIIHHTPHDTACPISDLHC